MTPAGSDLSEYYQIL